jgi:hypothetical protein
MSASTTAVTKVGETKTAEIPWIVNGRVRHLDLDPRTSLKAYSLHTTGPIPLKSASPSIRPRSGSGGCWASSRRAAS